MKVRMICAVIFGLFVANAAIQPAYALRESAPTIGRVMQRDPVSPSRQMAAGLRHSTETMQHLPIAELNVWAAGTQLPPKLDVRGLRDAAASQFVSSGPIGASGTHSPRRSLRNPYVSDYRQLGPWDWFDEHCTILNRPMDSPCIHELCGFQCTFDIETRFWHTVIISFEYVCGGCEGQCIGGFGSLGNCKISPNNWIADNNAGTIILNYGTSCDCEPDPNPPVPPDRIVSMMPWGLWGNAPPFTLHDRPVALK